MKKYFTATVLYGIPNFIYLVSGIIKNKIIALVLKTEGLGMISMGTYAINSLVPLSTLGLQLSVIKHSAESKSDEDAHRVLLAAAIFTLFNSLILAVFFIIFRKPLSLWIFSSASYSYVITLVALAIPFYSLFEILVHYLKGRKFITSITLGNSIAAVSTLLVSIPLIYFLKIKGGLLQIFTTGLISFLVVSIFVFRGKGVFENFSRKTANFLRLLKSLVRAGFGLYFIPRMFYISTLFLVKIMIIKKFDFKYNGIYESVTLLSMVIFSFFSDTLLGYFLPSICNNTKTDEKNNEINKVIRFLVFISVPMIIIVGSYAGRFLINALFSKQFLLAFEFLPIRFMGDYFFIINSAITYVFISNSNYRVVTFISLFYNASILGLSFFLPAYMGFKGYFVAYLLTTFLLFIIVSHLLKKECSMGIFKKNYNMILLSAGVMLASFSLAQNKDLQFLIIPLLIAWLLLNFSIKELKGHLANIKKFIMLNKRLKTQ